MNIFNKISDAVEDRIKVELISPDPTLCQKIKSSLEQENHYQVEVHTGTLTENFENHGLKQNSILLIVELTNNSGDISILEKLVRLQENPPKIIVISEALDEKTARILVKLHIVDLLSKDFGRAEILEACQSAFLSPATSIQTRADCTTFISAVGGAGATSLAQSLLDNLISDKKINPRRVCIADLNFQCGTLADYLELKPNFDISEVNVTPERLDWQLLDIMLTRHSSGFSLLATPTSLTPIENLNLEIVGRVLDLISSNYDKLVIDLPPYWLPWCENIVRGSDQFFIVTNLSVAGLRRARRIAKLISELCEVDTTESVIVNRIGWLKSAGLSKRHAEAILGSYLAGFVRDAGKQQQEAQNSGVLLSSANRKSPILIDLKKIMTQRS